MGCRRSGIASLAMAAVACAALAWVANFPAPAFAAPKPKKETILPAKVVPPPDPDAAEADEDSVLNGLPRTYRALVHRFGTMSPADSMGNGLYAVAENAFTSGDFENATKTYNEFAKRFPRNLRVNDALSTMLLIKDARDFEDKPLLLYARARAHRDAGNPDSANVLLLVAAERYPGAKVRYHVNLMLAELAQARGDHAHALQWAVAAADTNAANRLAPYALKIAAESSIALNETPQKALGYYRTILERYPDSPVTPEARTRALAIRKRMPQ